MTSFNQSKHIKILVLYRHVSNVCMADLVHYSDVTCVSWPFKLQATCMFVQQFVQANFKKDIKLCITDHLWGILHVDSPHKGPVTQKVFTYHDIILFLCHKWSEQVSQNSCHLLPKWSYTPGPCLNIKTIFSRYGDSHVKDKTVVRPSYL